jgi:hypothetical protein
MASILRFAPFDFLKMPGHHVFIVGVLLLLLLMLPGTLFSQVTPTPSSPDPTPALSRTDVIFVPYDKMTGPKFGKDQSILIPYAEFLKLKAAAQKEPDKKDFIPVASIIQGVYKGTVTGDMVEFEAKLTVDVLAPEDKRLAIDIPFGKTAIFSVAVEGEEAALAALEKGQGIRLHTTGPGQRTVTLRMASPLRVDGVTRRMEFNIPRAAASSVELEVDDVVNLLPGKDRLPASVVSNESGKSVIRASAGSHDALLLAWRPKVEKTGAAAQTRFAVHQDITYTISSGGITGTLNMPVEVLTGSMDSIAIHIPEGIQVQNISGPFVKDWSEPNESGIMNIALLKTLSENFHLHFRLLYDPPGESDTLIIPEFRIPDAVREKGTLRIKPEQSLTLWTEQAEGVMSMPPPRDMPLTTRAYSFEQPGWNLTMTIQSIPPRLLASGLVLYEVMEQFVKVKSRHNLTVSGRGVFGVVIEIPEGYTLREAAPQELVAGYRQQGNKVEVNFRGEQRAVMTLELSLQRERTGGEGRVTLEPLVIEGAEEDTGNVILAAPSAFRASEISAENLEATDVRPLLGILKPLQSPDVVPVLAYRYFNSEYEAVAAVERQRTRVTCETSRLVSIMPSLMRIDTMLKYNVEFSATDVFHVLVPSFVGEDVRISGADIKEKVRAGDGRVTQDEEELTTWTIRLQRRIIGPYQLNVSFDMPIEDSESGSAITISVPRVRAGNVARETGYIAVSRGENLEVSVAESEGLEPRDVKELPTQLASAFLGFRYFDASEHFLSLDLVRHELEEVLGALIRRLHMETVLNDQGEAVHEVFFEVQNNNKQYLELKLPEGMTIWSAFVRGAAVRPITRQSDGASLIELAKSMARDKAFRVRLIIKETMKTGKAAGKGLGTKGTLVFKPVVPMKIPVLRTTRKLYLPRGYRYIDFGGTMQLAQGGKAPWIEPTAEHLLNDIPASVAGGVAKPGLQPKVSVVGVNYNTDQTPDEKRALMQGTALEVPIVREGVQFVFSKLSGVGTIEVTYWKRRPLVLLQGLVGIAVFIMLMLIMRMRNGPAIGVCCVIVFLIAASLTEGLAGRLLATAFGISAAALVIGGILFMVKRRKSAKKEESWAIMPEPEPEKEVEQGWEQSTTNERNLPDHDRADFESDNPEETTKNE